MVLFCFFSAAADEVCPEDEVDEDDVPEVDDVTP